MYHHDHNYHWFHNFHQFHNKAIHLQYYIHNNQLHNYNYKYDLENFYKYQWNHDH